MKKNIIIDREKLARNMRSYALSKPHFESCNYGTLASYMSDYNRYKKDADYNRAMTQGNALLATLKTKTDEKIIDSFESVWSGRLEIKEDMTLSYCVGQYYCTEYQGALKAVIKELLNN